MRKKDSSYKYLAMISQVGFSVIVPIALMTLFGKVLDHYFHTGNMGVIICAIIGVLAGMRNLYIIPLRLSEKAQKNNKEKNKKDEKSNEND
jgi:F0F1-type ATP synthase assembly protein I